jgi:hypothetical protein
MSPELLVNGGIEAGVSSPWNVKGNVSIVSTATSLGCGNYSILVYSFYFI